MVSSEKSKIELIFTGTGTSQGIPVIGCECKVCTSSDPRDKRLRTSLLIRSALTTLVIDAGPDFREQMLRHNVKRLDAVLLTHAHHDHVAGLDDVRAFNYLQKQAMPIYGSAQCLQLLQSCYAYAFDENKYPGVPEFLPVAIEPFQRLQINEIHFCPFPVYHGKIPIFGYLLDDFAYITDASYVPPETIEFLKGIRILIVNALRHEPHHSHFHFQAALELAVKLNVQSVYLTHISHTAGTYNELSSSFPPNVHVAYDGLTLTI